MNNTVLELEILSVLARSARERGDWQCEFLLKSAQHRLLKMPFDDYLNSLNKEIAHEAAKPDGR